MATFRPSPTVGWPAFFVWMLGGGLLTLSLLGMASIGLFILPLALILLGLTVAFAPEHRDRWGVLAGVGGIVLGIGLLNIGRRTCPEQGWVVLSEDGSYSCGGLVAWPWLVAAVLVIAAAVFMYQRHGPGTRREPGG